MKRVFSEKIGLAVGFALYRLGEFREKLIEGCGRRKFEHDPLVDQLPQRFPLGDSTDAMILLRGIQGVQKFSAIEADRITERFEVLLRNLEFKTVSRSFHDLRC